MSKSCSSLTDILRNFKCSFLQIIRMLSICQASMKLAKNESETTASCNKHDDILWSSAVCIKLIIKYSTERVQLLLSDKQRRRRSTRPSCRLYQVDMLLKMASSNFVELSHTNGVLVVRHGLDERSPWLLNAVFQISGTDNVLIIDERHERRLT